MLVLAPQAKRRGLPAIRGVRRCAFPLHSSTTLFTTLFYQVPNYALFCDCQTQPSSATPLHNSLSRRLYPRHSSNSPKPSDHAKRMQRTFKGEFYTQPLPSRIPELQRELNAYLDYYNRRRPHRALNALAPLEFLAMMQGESVPEESQM